MTTFRLVCRTCGTAREPGPVGYTCTACGGELVVAYPGLAPVRPGATGMWRHQDRLPVSGDVVVSLGEGGTPLVPVAAEPLGVASALVKCEHLNPTGSFKDRIASVALSIAAERGLAGCVGTSSGNGGAAAAAYAARAGLACVLFALADTAEQKLLQIRALGASVHLVAGLGHDAAATDSAARDIAALAAECGLLPMLTGGRFSPEAMEGATTIAFELAEEAPRTTVVYAPVGGGGLLSAIGRGYGRMPAGPRLVAVQPAGCPTLGPALRGRFDGLSGPCTTGISGLQVAVLFDGAGAVEAVRGSGGHLTEVTDEQVHEAQQELARQGVLVEPAGATAYAGALADAAAGRLGPDDRVVLIATGAGYKDSAALGRLAGPKPAQRIEAHDIRKVLADVLR
ncbi:pyridoxal-phosphate dependent enzyme [Dactylosporangium sp. NPDC000555]|uniref:pyridoxal-phosphate dependent enzyme n=1 Tax=Dactylosporangium sp. NPDC000555 TaxID=3154260 RepID=UPI00332B11F7